VPFVTHLAAAAVRGPYDPRNTAADQSACALVTDRDGPPTLPLLLTPPTASSIRGPAAESGGVTMGASIPRRPMSVAAVPRELRGGSCPSRFAAGPLLALTRARQGVVCGVVWCVVCGAVCGVWEG